MLSCAGRFATVVFLILAAGCGSESTDPMGPGAGPEIPVANPDGVLLDGDGNSVAREAVEPLPPSPAASGEVVDGLLTTRLMAWIRPTATVDAVNAALSAQGARIVSMQPGSPFVTLKIPPVADATAAQAVAAALRASGAFGHVTPAQEVVPDVATFGLPSAALAPASVSTQVRRNEPHHLRHTRVLPTWNARRLALENNDRIAVLVPDTYGSTVPHAEIDAQRMTGFGGALSLPGPQIHPGNQGFVVSGVIGANVDETPPTGINPLPETLLDIRSMPLGGLTWQDVFWLLAWEIADAGDRFVLNTGIGYNDADFSHTSRFDRAMHVIAWRFAAHTHYERFLHVTSAGRPTDQPELNSPFVATASFDDVRDMVDLTTLTPEDSMALEGAWADLLAAAPGTAVRSPNVLTVGSSDAAGGLSDFSADGMVRTLGASILGPCIDVDPDFAGGDLCDGETASYSGTGVAAAQISGLAAYMMNLREVPPSRIRQILLERYALSGGLIDAYEAVLALDDATAQPIREALLDVAGFESSDSDGRFDQFDLEVLAGLTSGGGPIVAAAPEDVYPDSQRQDLNGDGVVGGIATARFDLDNDGSYTTVTQNIEGNAIQFDENAVTDFQIVCYNAYADVYRGDLTQRAQYVVPGHSGLFVQLEGVPERVSVGDTATVTVTAGFNVEGGGVETLEGVAISLELDGVTAAERNGTTQANGTFRTVLTFGDHENIMTVQVWAETEEHEATTQTTAKRRNQVELVDRTVFAYAEVFAVYNLDVGIPGVRFIQKFSSVDPSDFAPIDTTLTETGAASAQGMNVDGDATVDVRTRVDLGSGTDLFGMSLTSSTDSRIHLSNPNFNILSYQVQSSSEVYVSIEFYVWGDPAPFNMHGSVQGQEYEIELDGPGGDIFLCDSSDAPCSTISTGGLLQPGRYELTWYQYGGGQIRWFQDCQGCTTQGTQTAEGSLDINFEVNHNDPAGSVWSVR